MAFFFRRIKRNTTGRYEEEFPYVSPCGPETNYVRCDDLPVVFTQLLDGEGQPIQDIESYGNSTMLENERQIPSADHIINVNTNQSNFNGGSGRVTSKGDRTTQTVNVLYTELLSYGGAGATLTVPFCPAKLCMLPEGGRVYHTGPEKLDGVGLIKSNLAIELSRFFVYEKGSSENSAPVGFRWRGKTWTIDGSTVKRLQELKLVT